MPRLTVLTDNGTHHVSFGLGSSVRDILDAAGLRIRSGCRGNGACGLCLVQLEAGSANDLTRNERLTLPREQLQRKTRLACQVVPQADLCVRILRAAPPPHWWDLSPGHLPCTPPGIAREARTPSAVGGHGVAVDVGTTHISFSLWDLTEGRRLAGRTGPNPQSQDGADVVTRLTAAGESWENARRLSWIPLNALSEALLELSTRNGYSPREISRLAVVGNTPMLVLLTGTEPERLLTPRAWSRPIDLRPHDSPAWASALGIHPQASVEVVAPLAGFVGSDLLAGVLATRLTERAGSLLIDFGTNSEIAFWDGTRLWATSAAGGPAFEGCGMQSGVPAGPGAIFRVEQHPDSAELRCQTIGGGVPTGLCGSGLVDVIALWCGTGELTRTGKFVHRGPGHIIHPGHPAIQLTGADVDRFQRAKAAIGVGVETLLALAHRGLADLNRVCVGGVFGQHLDIRNAQRVGLLPNVPPERVELCGNTALAGCERLVLSGAPGTDLVSIRERATVINLAETADFDQRFLANLYLQPSEGGAG